MCGKGLEDLTLTMTFRFKQGTFRVAEDSPQYATPLEIAMAVHYVTKAEPYAVHDPNHAHSQAVRDITDRWCNIGYLAPATGDLLKAGCDYEPTDALRLYVDTLTRVPLPEKQWVIPSS